MTQITITEKLVTPQDAEDWLLKNQNNRKLRPSHVARLSRLLSTQEFVLTHQPIAFDVHGNLVDGQHRLKAIVTSRISAPLLVAQYNTTQSALGLPIDNGVLRTDTDISQISGHLVKMAKMYFYASGTNLRRKLTLQEIKDIIQHFGTPSQVRCVGVTGSAPFRTAFWISGQMKDYDLWTRGLLSRDDSLRALYSQVTSRILKSEGSRDQIFRCLRTLYCIDHPRVTKISQDIEFLKKHTSHHFTYTPWM